MNCEQKCSPGCVNGTCDVTDGTCLKGCLDGYSGYLCEGMICEREAPDSYHFACI